MFSRALKQAKCGRVYQEKASGAKADRPELMKLLDNARKGDIVIVWKLDRLARSIRQLLDTTALLSERGVELYSLTENINTATPSGKLTSISSPPWPNLSATSCASGSTRVSRRRAGGGALAAGPGR